ncbi:hypothetical protein ACFL2K_03880 [Candidatus Margulisiibacteriota bacterium]
MNRNIILGLLIILIIPSYIFASTVQEKQFLLEADAVEYVDKNVYASGNVVLQFNNYDAKMDRFNYIYATKELRLIDDVVIEKGKTKIVADIVTYNLKTMTGTALNVTSSIEHVMITGDKFNLLEDKIEITKAYSTTCKISDPHYYIKAKRLLIFPQYNYFVAFDNFFYFYNIPIFYFPTYIYGEQAYNIFGAKTPLPEAGQNPAEGWFLKQRLSFFVNPQLSGLFTLGYTEKQRLLAAIETSFNLNPYNNLLLNYKYMQERGHGGGVSYYLDLSRRKTLESGGFNLIENLFTNFIPKRTTPLGIFSLHYQFNILENNYWIDYTPLVKYNLKDFEEPFFDFNISSDLNWSFIREYINSDSFISSRRININGRIGKSDKLSPDIDCGYGFNYKGYFYKNNLEWHRFFGDVSLSFPEIFLSPIVKYTKLFTNKGVSFFNFDYENQLVSDELGYKVFLGVGDLKISYEASYNLDTNEARLSDLEIKFGPECWNFGAKARFIQKDVLFGFEIH